MPRLESSEEEVHNHVHVREDHNMADQGCEVSWCAALSLHNVSFHADMLSREWKGSTKCGIKRADEENMPFVLNPGNLVAPKAVRAGPGRQRVAGQIPVAGIRSNV